jgi:hypothetical protein
MATDLGSTKTVKAAAKHDAFVQAQLDRAEKRIRWLDTAAALLGFAAIFCAFLAAAAYIDRSWSMPAWVRQLALAGFVVGAGAYLYRTLARPLWYNVNPYYAAQRVERTMPGAKNSVVNWLDLQQQTLPPAIRSAVGQKAAKDLSKADIDHAFSNRRLIWAGGVAGACAALLLGSVVALGADSFFHFKRVLAPFSFGTPSRTAITITRPADGNDTVTQGQAVSVTARVEGKVPDAKAADPVKLLYRYEQTDPYLERVMRHEGGGEFTATISARDVKAGGLWYKVTGGGAETPEYRINVRVTPLLTQVQATYHFRPYVARDDEDHYARLPFALKAWRGTEVTLLVQTNRPVQNAYFLLDGKDSPERHAAEVIGEERKTFRVKHVFEKTTHYRLEYTTPENETYTGTPQDLIAVPDKPPEVEVAVPARDTACNAVFSLEGIASDDIGVKSVTLKMRLVNGPELAPKPYRSDKELRLAHGGYPRSLAYKDFVDLKAVTTTDGKPFAPAAGTELEYWLEASDACDYPAPNVGKSKTYRIKLLDPVQDAESRKDELDKAKNDQQKHEGKQNEDLKQEDRQRQANAQHEKDRAGREKDEVSGEHDNAAGSENDKPKPAGEPKGNSGNEGNAGQPSPAQKDRDEKTKQQANDLMKAINEKRMENKPKHSEAKPNPVKPGEKKDQGPPPDADHPPAEAKPENKADPKQPPAAAKKQPPPNSDAPKPPAEKKDEGKNSDQICPKGACKNPGQSMNPTQSTPQNTPSPTPIGEGKSAGQNSPGDKKSEPKPGGTPTASEGKASAPPAPNGNDTPMAQGKGDSPSGGTGPDPKGDAKDATSDDVNKAIDGLNSDSLSDRKSAAQKLDQISREAKDDKVRQQAKEALQDKDLKPKGEPEAKNQPDDRSKPQTAPKGKNDADKQGASENKKSVPEAPKSEDRGLGRGTPEPDMNDDPDDPLKKEELQRQREEFLKKLEEEQRKRGEFDAKKWEEFKEKFGNKVKVEELGAVKEKPAFVPAENVLKPDDQTSPPPPDKNEKATTLQLQKFIDAIDKKTLEKAGLTEEQWREFLKNYSNLAKREDPSAQEKPVDPKNGGPLRGTGGVRENPGTKGDTNDAKAGKPKPPPGYRDALERFSRDVTSPDEKK